MAGGKEGEGPRFEPTSQQPRQPDQKQPLQGRAAGRESIQGPTTFDGHEPDAYKHDPAIFQSRTLEAMKALRNNIERAQAHAGWIVEINREERAKQLAETGKVDLPFFLTDNEIRTASYEKGLRDAFNLIIHHIQGNREDDKSQGGLPQDSDIKK